MKPLFAQLAATLALTAMLVAPAFAAVELDQSATFGVGAIVSDVCQVSNAYRAYINNPSKRADTWCTASRPASGSTPEPVTTVTRGENGAITALNIEF